MGLKLNDLSENKIRSNDFDQFSHSADIPVAPTRLTPRISACLFTGHAK